MTRRPRALAALAAVGALALAGALAACDTTAKPSSAAAGPAADPDRLSREHESCGTTAHCAEGLRCFEQTCRRVDRSVLGDYHAALAARAEAAGDLPRALEAYAAALAAYDTEKLEAPVDLECAYGGALADARADKERAELGARVLHRCIGGAPAGSALRQAALRDVAALDEAGLDPAHLARSEPADVYLSRAPARPPVDKLAVTVTATPVPRAKGWPDAQAAIVAARTALVACWEANYAAKGEAAMSVAVPMRSDYKDSGYDDEPGYYLTGVDPKAPPAATDVERCVRDAVDAAMKGVKGSGSWQALVTVAVQ